MTALLTPEQVWSCPNCSLSQVTHEHRPHTRFHACPGLKGMTAPMLPAGMRCKVTVVERDDYIGGDLVQRDGEGRPIMAVVTERDDGMDRIVFAPTATIGRRHG